MRCAGGTAMVSLDVPGRSAEDGFAGRADAPRGVRFIGHNRVQLLLGGDELFPAMCRAIDSARGHVWVATYIYLDDGAGRCIGEALRRAVARGVHATLIVDGFGSKSVLETLREQSREHGIELQVFRPVDRWWSWLRSGQLRRLHQKLCVVDDRIAFVGGINILDDRFDMVHGSSPTPRWDFAVELHGPVVALVQRMAQALSLRARLGQHWKREVHDVAHSDKPMERAMGLLRGMRGTAKERELPDAADTMAPVRVAFVARDNLRQRRAIERSYIAAMRQSRERIDIACPYFYPGRAFKRSLLGAARRGVQVRLLLQGKVDYRIAGLAAQVLYEELLAHGVRIYEYTPAFLHAKVAVIDDDWATVGSSNIDPLSLLLNLEANAVVRDADFAAQLRARFEQALAASVQIVASPLGSGWRRWFSRGFVAWSAGLYLRLAGINSRY